MEAGLAVLSRWVHVAGVVILLGGAFYARFCARSYSPRFGPWARAAAAAIVASGIYNLLAKASLPPGYHLAFGIKMLLALHVLGVSVLAGSAAFDEAKRLRLMAGVVYSGFAAILIAAWLQWISAS